MATEQVPGEDRAMVGEQAPTEEVSASVKEDPCKETTNQVGNDGAIHPIQNAKVAVRVFCNLSVLSDVISLVKTSKVFHEVYVTNTRLILLAVLSRSLPHFADAEALLEAQKGETERHKLQANKENPSENLTNGVTKNGTEAGTDITVETPKEETSVEQPQVENVASESSASIQQPGATSPGEPLDNDSIQASAIDTQKMQELSLEELLNDVEILKAAADAKKLQNATLEKPVKLEGDSGDAATDVKKLDQVALPQPANSEDGSEDTIGWAKQLLANHRTVMTACQFFEKLTHPRVSQADAVEAARRTRAFNPRGNRAPGMEDLLRHITVLTVRCSGQQNLQASFNRASPPHPLVLSSVDACAPQP